MRRELRCACHGDLIGYEVTPGDGNTGPCTGPPRTVGLTVIIAEGPITPGPGSESLQRAAQDFLRGLQQ